MARGSNELLHKIVQTTFPRSHAVFDSDLFITPFPSKILSTYFYVFFFIFIPPPHIPSSTLSSISFRRRATSPPVSRLLRCAALRSPSPSRSSRTSKHRMGSFRLPLSGYPTLPPYPTCIAQPTRPHIRQLLLYILLLHVLQDPILVFFFKKKEKGNFPTDNSLTRTSVHNLFTQH